MITIYQYDKNGFATGNTREQSERQPIPPGWTHKEPSGVEGERFIGNVWQVVPLSLEKTKENKLNEINHDYEQELNEILKKYPEVETKTWDKQEAEAIAWVADNTVATPLLTEIANARGITLDVLVPKVIEKANAWIQLSGAATGKRQALEEAVNAATTVAEVEAITW